MTLCSTYIKNWKLLVNRERKEPRVSTYLVEYWIFSFEFGANKICNLFSSPGLLPCKLITGKSQNLETCTFTTTNIKRLEQEFEQKAK